ncbi:MAG: Uma2 family endonuclease [Hyphomicrobiaceae bacterium]
MTVAQFLDWPGDGTGARFELVDGAPRAMAPASATHAIIQANAAAAIATHLRTHGLRFRAGIRGPVTPPLKSRINARAPDVTVTCAPPSDSPVFEDPILIVEVISPSGETQTWESIRALAALTSLREILIVSSTSVEAQVFRRDASGAWPYEPDVVGQDGVARLDSIGLALPMAEIYRGTHLA